MALSTLANTAASAVMQSTNSVIENINNKFAANMTSVAGKSLATLIGVGASDLEDIIDALVYQPSLCYIPIQSESFEMIKQVDVGTTMLVTQSAGHNVSVKDYYTDNAAPRPRQWKLQGYIRGLAPLIERNLLIKPTLLVQQAILEAAADSRSPVKLKTDTGEVVDVLITSLSIAGTPKGNNVRIVNAQVQEVKILQNTNLAELGLDSAPNSVLNSLPNRALINLGETTAIGAITVAGADLLLGLL